MIETSKEISSPSKYTRSKIYRYLRHVYRIEQYKNKYSNLHNSVSLHQISLHFNPLRSIQTYHTPHILPQTFFFLLPEQYLSYTVCSTGLIFSLLLSLKLRLGFNPGKQHPFDLPILSFLSLTSLLQTELVPE